LASSAGTARSTPLVVALLGEEWLRCRWSLTQYYTATSLDGFIADADNSLDRVVAFLD